MLIWGVTLFPMANVMNLSLIPIHILKIIILIRLSSINPFLVQNKIIKQNRPLNNICLMKISLFHIFLCCALHIVPPNLNLLSLRTLLYVKSLHQTLIVYKFIDRVKIVCKCFIMLFQCKHFLVMKSTKVMVNFGPITLFYIPFVLFNGN